MAKSKGFYGLRRGSTKSMTYSVLRGQQITKDRVEGGANPKTYPQMIQRMYFANAVKFYKHAKAGFFKFAYEDKKSVESDYNAFMRHNALNAVSVARNEYQLDNFPALGKFFLSKGSLPTAGIQWEQGNKRVEFEVKTKATGNTVGAYSQVILDSYPALQPGDIVTIVVVKTALNNESELDPAVQPQWDIRQFVLDVNDTRNASQTLGLFISTTEAIGYISEYSRADFDTTHAMGCAVIFSRNTPNGLKVSDGYLRPNGVALEYIDDYSTEGTVNACASTWGATDPAILAGGLAK